VPEQVKREGKAEAKAAGSARPKPSTPAPTAKPEPAPSLHPTRVAPPRRAPAPPASTPPAALVSPAAPDAKLVNRANLAFGSPALREDLAARRLPPAPPVAAKPPAPRPPAAAPVAVRPARAPVREAPPAIARKAEGPEPLEPLAEEPEAWAALLDRAIPALEGRPLDDELRATLEARLGEDFSDVRIHTGAAAAEAARTLRAYAYTVGRDIVFGAGHFAPESSEGLHLLAHELAHVAQQRLAPASGLGAGLPVSRPGDPGELEADRVADAAVAGGGLAARPQLQVAPAIQRQPLPPGGKSAGGVIDYVDGPVTLRAWPEQGLMSLSLVDEPWVTVRWTPHGQSRPDFTLGKRDGGQAYVVQVNAPFDLRVTVARLPESMYAAQRLGGASFVHRYTARGHKVQVNEHLPGGGNVAHEGDFTDDKQYDGHPVVLNSEGFPTRPAPGGPMTKTPPPFWWQFDRLAQLDLFARGYPGYYWLAFGPSPDGTLTAWNVDEKLLQNVAYRYRLDPSYAATVLAVYEYGERAKSPEELYERFYFWETDAWRGAPGDAPECILYHHGKTSLGRKSLTQSEARRYWESFDNLDSQRGANNVRRQIIDGQGPFHSLVATGHSGKKWYIDTLYFDKRDLFRTNARDLALGSGRSWSDLFRAEPEIYDSYVRPALDRPSMEVGRELQDAIAFDSDFREAAGERLLEEVEGHARSIALGAIGGAKSGLAVYLEREAVQRLVLQLPFMTADRRAAALEYVGVGSLLAGIYEAVFSDPVATQRVWMGESYLGVSLDTLQACIWARFSGMDEFYDAIFNRTYNPLAADGDFGKDIRKRTYKDYGFRLDPEAYPHEDEADQRTSTSRPGSVFEHFGSEAGYIYARAVADRAISDRHWKYFKIALVVVASVALVLLANAAGAALAGLLFSEATLGGAILFTATELTVSAGIVTLAGPAVSTFIMSGGSLDLNLYKGAYKNLGKQFLVNLLTFGFFKGLSWGVRAFAIAEAGGKAAFDASKGWQAAEFGLRVTTSGSAMFGISVLQYRLEHGKLPEGESLNEMLFETGLSLVLMEVSAHYAKPYMETLAEWARDQRLGDLAGRMDDLRIEIFKLNGDVANFGADPIGGRRRGIELLSRQKRIVIDQKKLLADLRESFRNRPEATKLERQLDGELAELDANIAAIAGVEAFAKAEVLPGAPTGGDTAEFTYKRGHEQELIDYYGKDKVVEVDGRLEVTFQGKKLIFRPATDVEAGIRPDGTHAPQALEAWQTTSIGRQRKVVERSTAAAADDPVLRDVANADPRSMDIDALRAFEKQLAKAEKLLDKLATKGPVEPISTERGLDSNEPWRARLVAERARLLRLARILGLEGHPLVREMMSRPMQRSGLKENTLHNYRESIDRVRELLDGLQAEKLKALDAAAGAPPPDVKVIRDRLTARHDDVVRRAGIYGTEGRAYIEAVRALRARALRAGGTESPEALAQAEATIAKAEAMLDALSKKAFADGVAKHGADALAEARATPGLEKLTDAQVGDVLRMLQKSGKLSPDALRGALRSLFTVGNRSPVPLDKLVKFAGDNHEDLEFVLGTFEGMQQIKGAYDVLRDAASSPGKWKGSIWQFEIARYEIGIGNIRSMEVKEGGRVVDITKTNGDIVECKDWLDWRPDKVDEQFFEDLKNKTRGGTYARGLKDISWIFRGPSPVGVAKIRSTMRATLERFIAEKRLKPPQADALRKVFDAHVDLVMVPEIDRTQVLKPPFVWHPPLPPPQHKDDDAP
jgi:hypothetical protein